MRQQTDQRPSELGSLGIRYLRDSTDPGFESRGEQGRCPCANTRRYPQALGLAPPPPPPPPCQNLDVIRWCVLRCR